MKKRFRFVVSLLGNVAEVYQLEFFPIDAAITILVNFPDHVVYFLLPQARVKLLEHALNILRGDTQFGSARRD
jgi:hypothetical protein